MKILNKSITLIIISFILLLLIACSSDDDNNSSECSNTICTEEFKTITVQIKDENQDPISLDSFEVINIENEEDLTILLSASGFELAQQLGEYPIIADGSIQVNQEINLLFKGFINNIEIINSNYTVTADCCHVNLISGDVLLILE